jgi:hypothetical protein
MALDSTRLIASFPTIAKSICSITTEWQMPTNPLRKKHRNFKGLNSVVWSRQQKTVAKTGVVNYEFRCFRLRNITHRGEHSEQTSSDQRAVA